MIAVKQNTFNLLFSRFQTGIRNVKKKEAISTNISVGIIVINVEIYPATY